MKSVVGFLALLVLIASGCSSPAPGETMPTTAQATAALTQTDTTPSPISPSPSPTATFTPTPAPSSPTPTATASPTPGAYGPTNFPAGINPLTGLAVSNPAQLERRPVIVKVQLYPRTQRPVIGVARADIVYDYYQNSGLTRLAAVFYGLDTSLAGPVRSARLFDAHLVRMYKSFFAFGGADQRILSLLTNSEFANQLVLEGNNCPPMCRIDPNGFNFLVADTYEIAAYAQRKELDNTRQILDGMSFNTQVPPGGQPGTQVYVRYSIGAYTRWDYDPITGRYLRFQDDAEDDTGQNEVYVPLIDRVNEEQLAAENVVVLFVPHIYALKRGNTEIVDIQLNGSGQAIAMRDGQAYLLSWTRTAIEAIPQLTLPDGSLYPYKPGVTWYQVIGQGSRVTTEAGIWRFTFRLP